MNGICVVRGDHRGLLTQTGFANPQRRMCLCEGLQVRGSTLGTAHPLHSELFSSLGCCAMLELDFFFFY